MAPSAFENGLETDQRVLYQYGLYIGLFADNGVAHDDMADAGTSAYRDVWADDRVAHLGMPALNAEPPIDATKVAALHDHARAALDQQIKTTPPLHAGRARRARV